MNTQTLLAFEQQMLPAEPAPPVAPEPGSTPMTFYEAAAKLGLPAYARLTMYSHADQDACARLTGEKPYYQFLAEENARHIRQSYTRPDFMKLWNMNPVGLSFRKWLEHQLEHEFAASNNPYVCRRDRILCKFLVLRLREALDKLDNSRQRPLRRRRGLGEVDPSPSSISQLSTTCPPKCS